MIGIILTGHGNFATGLTSSIKLIAGQQEKFEVVDFLENYSTDDLKNELSKAIENLKDCEAIMIFSDLVGGSPFKIAVEISMNYDKIIKVIAGTNIGMLLEVSLSRNFETNIDNLVNSAINTGKEQVMKYEFIAHKEENTDGDGI